MNIALKISTMAIILFVTAEVELHNLPELARLNEPLAIYPKQKERSLFSNLGIINSVRQCGGSGRLLQWRSEGCTFNTHGLCIFPAGQYFRGELTFVPSKTSEFLGVYTNMKDAVNGEVLIDWQNSDLVNSSVEAGKEFALGGSVIALPEHRGRMVNSRFSIVRESDKEIEVCAEADFLVV